MLTPVYQDWSGGGGRSGAGSKGCKCNCGGFGYQTSMLFVMFPVNLSNNTGKLFVAQKYISS